MIRINQSIASADWSFMPQQEVRVGKQFGPDEVPADVAAAWLQSGLATPVESEPEKAVRPRTRRG